MTNLLWELLHYSPQAPMHISIQVHLRVTVPRFGSHGKPMNQQSIGFFILFMSRDLLMTMRSLDLPFPSYALWSLKLQKYHDYEYVFQRKCVVKSNEVTKENERHINMGQHKLW